MMSLDPYAPALKRASFPRTVPLALVLIYVITLVVYMANGRGTMFLDSGPTSHLALSVVRDGDLDLNELRPFMRLVELDYVTQEVNGKLISVYPVGTPIMAAPFYYLAMKAGIASDQYDGLAKLEKFAAANIGAMLSVLFWILLARRTTASPGLRVVLWIAFAFGTSNWAINSQALWQHGPLQICIILALLALPQSWEGRGAALRLVACGICLGMAGFMRPTGYILIPVWGVYILLKNWRLALVFGVGAILGFMPQVWYNLTYVPRGDGGYFQFIFGHDYFKDIHPVQNFFSLLFSPSRGLFIFSPYMALLALWAMPQVRKFSAMLDAPAALLACSCLAVFTIYLGFKVWWQGWCYGARFFSDILPFLFLLLVPPLQCLVSRRRLIAVPATVLAAIALTWSVGVQALGAVRYDGGWDGRVEVPANPDVAWDWRDNTIRDAWSGGVDPRATQHSAPYYEVAPGHIYQMGMRESRQFFFSGFYGQEGWGIWSRGAQPAVMKMHFPAGEGKLYLAAMGTGSNFAPARYDIYLNGRRVKKAKLYYDAFTKWQHELVEIPLRKNRLTGGVETIEIKSRDGRRAGPNGRFYGLGIKKMVYIPTTLEHMETSKTQQLMAND